VRDSQRRQSTARRIRVARRQSARAPWLEPLDRPGVARAGIAADGRSRCCAEFGTTIRTDLIDYESAVPSRSLGSTFPAPGRLLRRSFASASSRPSRAWAGRRSTRLPLTDRLRLLPTIPFSFPCALPTVRTYALNAQDAEVLRRADARYRQFVTETVQATRRCRRLNGPSVAQPARPETTPRTGRTRSEPVLPPSSS
jgi:hypothetical protein